jgi:hypothetical protein
MGSERFEFESEAWYRAVAEGRVLAVSDRDGRPRPVPEVKGAAGEIRPPAR